MKLLQQPNRWSCVPTAFAMTANLTAEEFIFRLGHDGSEILWPSLEEPLKRKGFSINECLVAAIPKLYAYLPTISCYCPGPNLPECIIRFKPDYIKHLIKGQVAILAGTVSGHRHCVAWNGEKVFDPNGTIYGIDRFTIEQAYLMLG